MGKSSRAKQERRRSRQRRTVELERLTGARAPFTGPDATRALQIYVDHGRTELIAFVSAVDYGQMVHLALNSSESDDWAVANNGDSLLQLVHAGATDGPDILDDRDWDTLKGWVLDNSNMEQLLKASQAGLVDLCSFDPPTVQVSGSFDLQGWARSVVLDVPQLAGQESLSALYADPVAELLLDVVNGRTPHVPAVLVDIDSAMRTDYDFGVPELLLVLHLLWSSTYRDEHGGALSFLAYRGHLEQVLKLASREYPWLFERASVDRLLDFLTIPFGRTRAGRGFRYGYAYLTPLIEMPFGYTPNGFEGCVMQPEDEHRGSFGWVRINDQLRAVIHAVNRLEPDRGNELSRSNTFLMTSDDALGASLRLWQEILLDGEWPFGRDEAPTVVSAIRRRRQQQRPIDEFETAVPQALQGLGMQTWTNLAPSVDGTHNELGLVLRNEIDVIASDPTTQTVWVVEVKDQVRCWTAASQATRIKKYLEEFVPKLQQKLDDVNDSRPELSARLGIDLREWTINACFITRYRDPAAYDSRIPFHVVPVGWVSAVLQRADHSSGRT